ncbi:MAG TPA: thioredoxin domain-containing protein [Thermoanaerobaculia bacterium]|nr:thioredoxin domain-containing protein [Thermoanaerobaculia bacterium]
MIATRHTFGPRAVKAVLVLILALGVCLPACSAQDKDAKDKPKSTQGALAQVNGKDITEADVKTFAADQFSQLEKQYEQQKRELLEGALEQTIQDRLLAEEAKASGKTKEQILADMKPAAVTEADIDAFYEQNKAQIAPRTKEQVAPMITQYLEQQRQAELQQKFYEGLRAKHKIKYLMEPTRVEVAATGPAQGPATAPITIVEFSDFQCPYCARLIPTLDQVKAKYGDKVRIVFRQYPLSFHQNAQKAAEASLCANEQGKFWELHNAMFGNQQELAVEQLKAKAAELGMNAEQFNTCLDNAKFAAQVKADFDEGAKAGVSGTPAMFINGRFLSGAQPLNEITKVIDDELARKAEGSSSK